MAHRKIKTVEDAIWSAARTMQKAVQKRATLGYSHPPKVNPDGTAYFHLGDGQGRTLRVTVREYTFEEEMEDIRIAKEKRETAK